AEDVSEGLGDGGNPARHLLHRTELGHDRLLGRLGTHRSRATGRFLYIDIVIAIHGIPSIFFFSVDVVAPPRGRVAPVRALEKRSLLDAQHTRERENRRQTWVQSLADPSLRPGHSPLHRPGLR